MGESRGGHETASKEVDKSSWQVCSHDMSALAQCSYIRHRLALKMSLPMAQNSSNRGSCESLYPNAVRCPSLQIRACTFTRQYEILGFFRCNTLAVNRLTTNAVRCLVCALCISTRNDRHPVPCDAVFPTPFDAFMVCTRVHLHNDANRRRRAEPLLLVDRAACVVVRLLLVASIKHFREGFALSFLLAALRVVRLGLPRFHF